ncbi:MAG: hypothetical protein JXP34_28940 [Planctomycetes bacterium]|nr:hypothetical protein [Planctomycetota bacterium]
MQLRIYPFFTVLLASAAAAALGGMADRILHAAFGAGRPISGILAVVILGSVTCGLAAGGQFADHLRSAKWLYGILIAAGLCYVLPPFLDKPIEIADGLLGRDLGALATALMLFAVPGALLAATVPFGVRFASAASDSSRAGRAGGIAGTAVSFGVAIGWTGARLFLFPWIGLKATASAVAAALIAVGVVGMVLEKGRRSAALGLLLIFAALSPAPVPAPEGCVLAAETDAGPAWVAEGSGPGGARTLFVRGAPIVSGGERTLAVHLAPGGPGGGEREPHILAAGVEGLRWREYAPSLRIIESDPGLAALAREGLGSEGIETGDVRRILAGSGESYDWIVISLLREPPSHWVTREAFETVARRLSPGGMVAVLLRGDPRGARAGALCRTIRAVLPHVWLFADPPGGGAESEVEILASADAGRGAAIARRTEALRSLEVGLPEGPLLTDDRNPFDVLQGE